MLDEQLRLSGLRIVDTYLPGALAIVLSVDDPPDPWLGEHLLAGGFDITPQVHDVDYSLAAGQQLFDRALGDQRPLVKDDGRVVDALNIIKDVGGVERNLIKYKEWNIYKGNLFVKQSSCNWVYSFLYAMDGMNLPIQV